MKFQVSHSILLLSYSFVSKRAILTQLRIYIFNLSVWLSGAFVVGVPCSSGSCLGPKNQIAGELFPWVCHLCLCGPTICICHWLMGKRISGWSLEWSYCGWKTEGNFCGCSIFSFIVVLICFAELSVCLGRAFCKYLPMEINNFFFHFVVR